MENKLKSSVHNLLKNKVPVNQITVEYIRRLFPEYSKKRKSFLEKCINEGIVYFDVNNISLTLNHSH